MIEKKEIHFRSEVKVSALVSTYDSAEFMQGCLNDLTAQSLFKQGAMEILILDCASPGEEEKVVKEFQKSQANISYIRLSERETLYGAWNLGAQYARGQYLTNANTDDRHHPESIEKMLNALEAKTDCELCYGDVYRSSVSNESFLENSGQQIFRYSDFFAPDVLLHYQFGCQPLWKKSLHEKIGFFDDRMRAAGDYDFNLRFNLAGCKALHIPEVLGSFLEHDNSISKSDSTSTNEQQELRKQFISSANILKLYSFEGFEIDSQEQALAVLHDMAIKAMSFELPWHPGERFQDPEVALAALTAGLELAPSNPSFLNNLAALLHMLGSKNDSKQLIEALPDSGELSAAQKRNQSRLAEGAWQSTQLEFCQDKIRV